MLKKLIGFVSAVTFAFSFSLAPAFALGPQLTYGELAAGPGLKVNHYSSAAGTNSNLVYAGPYTLYAIDVVNSTATIEYLKLYNTATAPTCGTTAVYQTYQIPASTSVQLIENINYGAAFPAGLGFCITGAYADTDTTAAAAGVLVDFIHN